MTLMPDSRWNWSASAGRTGWRSAAARTWMAGVSLGVAGWVRAGRVRTKAATQTRTSRVWMDLGALVRRTVRAVAWALLASGSFDFASRKGAMLRSG